MKKPVFAMLLGGFLVERSNRQRRTLRFRGLVRRRGDLAPGVGNLLQL